MVELLSCAAQVAVISKFPNLVDLQGPARINQTDVAEIMGFTGTARTRTANSSTAYKAYGGAWCRGATAVSPKAVQHWRSWVTGNTACGHMTPSLTLVAFSTSVCQSPVLTVCCCHHAEYMGFLVRNGTDEDTPLLGLQSGTRVPQISDISVDKEGVAIKVWVCATLVSIVRVSWQPS